MTRLRSLFLTLPTLLVLGAVAGCTHPTDSESEAESENVAQVSQAYQVDPDTVMYHLTWHADDSDPPNGPEEPLLWTREYVTSEAGLTSEDWEIEYTWGYGRMMLVTDTFEKAVTISTFLSTVPSTPIGTRIEVTIGDPGRRW